MKNIIKAVALITVLSFASCNHIARKYGGSMTVDVDKDKKLVNCSWKKDELWLLTRQRKDGETPETYTYIEKSTFGILEGTVTIVEK